MILGPPGAGKSTSAQILSRNHGYVYYEADCFGMFVNPFVDPNVDEPTLAIATQKPLKVIITSIHLIQGVYAKSTHFYNIDM